VTDDPVLSSERSHLELARRCLAAMLESADRIADYGVDELASHSLGRIRAQRLAALSADPDAPPFFGRIDRTDEIFHIGRRHVRDDSGDPIVIDWRAPIARAFYRATPAERMGVRLRRRFGFHNGRLSSFEDEDLARGEALGLRSELLREEIERPRVGPMRDIVATIQPDQDDLVRADLDTSLCIQGAPGTGKTAVGLHRAAYLLYTFPDRLRRSGVLVVGPNDAFLHYIGEVLPSLGEVGITQRTVDGLLSHRPQATEPTELAVLKGDARLAEVCRRAVLSHVVKPTADVVAIVGTKRYRVGAHHLRRYVDDARRQLSAGLRWSLARERLQRQVAEDVRRQREDAGGAPSDAETAKVARSPAVRSWLDEVWPELDAASLLARLYDEPELLARCARGLLDEEEVDALRRPAPNPVRKIRWTPADTVLLDELAALLQPNETFVHVVVDEAQDLSPMQCRAVARRCPVGSITVLGDLAQATAAEAPGNWAVTLRHLGHPLEDGTQLRALTAGYRVPDEVLAVANRLLPVIAPDVPAATSVRQGPDSLRQVEVRGEASATVAEQVRAMTAVEGSIGVIVPDTAAGQVLDAIRAAGIDAAGIDDATATEVEFRVEVVPASRAKGLEFDSVVLFEPAAIVAAEATRLVGLRRLYVVMTRAVSRLCIVHAEPLPQELDG
jgi:DNA helicase IV